MVENKLKLINDGGISVDQLYTVDEMMSFFKVSRGTIYNFMKNGVIPYVEIGGQRRFIGSQVMKAVKDMQAIQAQARLRGDLGDVQNDTLSDVACALKAIKTSSDNDLKKLSKSAYKVRNSKNNHNKPR